MKVVPKLKPTHPSNRNRNMPTQATDTDITDPTHPTTHPTPLTFIVIIYVPIFTTDVEVFHDGVHGR